jgi:Zn-finger nucleic acid-binding protein
MNNCPACGAPLALKPDTAGFECPYCHSVFFPGEEDDGVKLSGELADAAAAGLDCPVCRQPLVNAALSKIPVLFCTACKGLLFHMEILPELIEQRRSTVDRPAVQTPSDRGDLKRVIQCPNCNRRMDTHFYAGPGNVVVDTCDNCSLIWLDRGELTRIAHAPDQDEAEP